MNPLELHKMERRKKNQRVITTATTRARARAPMDLNESTSSAADNNDDDGIDSKLYDSKVRINHWHDKMMEHKKIYYAAELKMYKLELALAKYDNSNKLRWSVRHREMANMIHHAEDDKAARRTPEPAFGYVPVTRRFESEAREEERSAKDSDNDGKSCKSGLSGGKNKRETSELIERDDDSNVNDDDEIRSIVTTDSDIAASQRNDLIPIHSEDYKPFSSTASIHSYMYHLRNIYGK